MKSNRLTLKQMLSAIGLGLLLAGGASTGYAKSSVPVEEVEALWGLQLFTNFSGWYKKTNWGFDEKDFASDAQPDPCRFYGITCNGGHIETIDLQANNLSGAVLPGVLVRLPRLKTLNLGNNRLFGVIPPLPASLESLDVSFNQFFGSIPPLPASLIEFAARSNQLTGSIPPLPASLKIFSVYLNQLTGSIPPLPVSLMSFDANVNQLTGSIPYLPPSLRIFSVPNNQLTGPMPSLPPSLKVFDAEYNQLTGQISQLPASLESLLISYNQLTGKLPAIPVGSLVRGATVCPNNLVKEARPEWDRATRTTPWYKDC